MERVFKYATAWGDSAGWFAVMPIEYENKDCYIVLDDDDVYAIYLNADRKNEEELMAEDMIASGVIDDNTDCEIVAYIHALQCLRDMYL